MMRFKFSFLSYLMASFVAMMMPSYAFSYAHGSNAGPRVVLSDARWKMPAVEDTMDVVTYEACVKRAMSLMEHDSLSQAESTLRMALEMQPALKANALLYRHIAQICEQQGRNEEALENYTLGVNLAPEVVSLRMDRASLYVRLNQTERAIYDYTCALDVEEDRVDALFFRAYLYMEQRDYKKARADYEHLVRLQPTNENALLGLALLNDKDNRPREAMEQMDNLVRIFPTHAILYAIRGGMKQRRRLYEGALKDLNTAIELEPGNADFYVSRATLYLDMRKKKLARQDLQMAVSCGADAKELSSLLK